MLQIPGCVRAVREGAGPGGQRVPGLPPAASMHAVPPTGRQQGAAGRWRRLCWAGQGVRAMQPAQYRGRACRGMRVLLPLPPMRHSLPPLACHSAQCLACQRGYNVSTAGSCTSELAPPAGLPAPPPASPVFQALPAPSPAPPPEVPDADVDSFASAPSATSSSSIPIGAIAGGVAAVAGEPRTGSPEGGRSLLA